MDLWGPLRLVLQTIQDLQGDSPEFFRDTEIASKARMPLKNVQNCLVVLHENEFISLTPLVDGFSASIEAKGRVALTYPSNIPLIVWTGVKVVPKGLRPFETGDSDFFLGLLPGPRNHDLPESISYWKERIEQRDPDKTFRVGVIYGPSGCGKTSLVKAGLVPQLPDDILVVDVEASPDETESLLKRRLAKACPEHAGAELAEAVSKLSQGSGLPAGKAKVVLIIDQFEQWLHGRQFREEEELAASLKNCDGAHVQAILLVRADFLMGVTRFMGQVGVTIRQDLNYAAVDLFGQRHAKEVLRLFGEAYGALPAINEKMEPEQCDFLDEAVRELARDEDEGRIAPVRLALFAQMLSEKAWSPSTLRKVGGAAGVGITFLEETFGTDRGRRRYQISQGDLPPIRSILKALLPELGTGIKGGRKSEETLLKESGCKGDRAKFQRLVHLLDGETRLITPTHEENNLNGSASDRQELAIRHYQLTHDYLVPSIREWLDRTQTETLRGRAEIRLAELTDLWAASKDARYLPHLWEWLFIALFSQRRRWSEPQKMLMRMSRYDYISTLENYFFALLFGTFVMICLIVWLLDKFHITTIHIDWK